MPCCTGVLRTLLFYWKQRLMPSVRMKMGIHHWYRFIILLILSVCESQGGDFLKIYVNKKINYFDQSYLTFYTSVHYLDLLFLMFS